MIAPITCIEGRVSVLARADVDTDQIAPKRFLKRTERRGYAEVLFHDWAREPGWDLPAAPILVTGRNFGCGSSREQAAWALQDYGFRALIAPSFGDIFATNCTKVGMLPVVLAECDVEVVGSCREAAVDLQRCVVECAAGSFSFAIDPEVRRRLLLGLDEISLTLEHERAIAAHERAHAGRGPRLPLERAG